MAVYAEVLTNDATNSVSLYRSANILFSDNKTNSGVAKTVGSAEY